VGSRVRRRGGGSYCDPQRDAGDAPASITRKLQEIWQVETEEKSV
jgi:hypothetical protein